MKDLTYKCHVLTINELPNVSWRRERLYRGTTTIDGKKWEMDHYSIYVIKDSFRDKIDNLYRDKTYEDVKEAWESDSTEITYKNHVMWIRAIKRAKDNRVFYIGVTSYYLDPARQFHYRVTSFESIHYNKIIAKFEKFVDEYCTDWRLSHPFNYKGYSLWINWEYGKENFFGVCEIHKNSKFKCISNSCKEIEDKFKARIDQILYYKQGIKKMEYKEYRVKQLEAQIARLQQEIEKVRKEETFTYKGVVLELTLEKDNWFNGVIKNAPKNTCTFYGDDIGIMKQDFQRYVDELEESTNIYLTLTGQEITKRANKNQS